MSQTITLGGKEYPVASLSLGQMEVVMPAFLRMGIHTSDGVRAQISICQAAMNAANDKITLADVQNLRGVSVKELETAVLLIASICGLEYKPTKEIPEGEAEAPAA